MDDVRRLPPGHFRCRWWGVNRTPAGEHPKRVIPPKPGPPRPGPPPKGSSAGAVQAARIWPPPQRLGPARQEQGGYVMDTGIALAFGAIEGGLQMLAAHYGDQLSYVDVVALELNGLATRPVRPLKDGHTPKQKAEHDRRVAVRAVAGPVAAAMQGLFGDPVELDAEDVAATDELIDVLCGLPKPKERDPLDGDRGECGSVRHAMKLRYGDDVVNPGADADDSALPVVVLCVNDGRGRRLATNFGICARSAVGVLREMVAADRFDENQAWAYYKQMVFISELPDDQKASGPEDFVP